MATSTSGSGGFSALTKILPGLLLAGVVAAIANYLEPQVSYYSKAAFGVAVAVKAPVLAIIIGIFLHQVGTKSSFAPGVTFSIKKLLRWAIALFGLKIAISDIIGLGPVVAILMFLTMVITLISGMVLGKLFGADRFFGALAGAGTAICGASAALATATVLPDYEEKDDDTAFVAVTVNLLATIAMLAYPPIAAAAHFSPRQTGVFLGAAIHDVAQVIGAGQSVSLDVLKLATVVKLFRVFLLLPVILGVGIYYCKFGNDDCGKAKVPFPWFAVMFVVFAVINTFHKALHIPDFVVQDLVNVSQWGILIAIAALGLNTKVKAFLNVGLRDIGVVGGATLVILLVSFGWVDYFVK
ncbi:MAG: putative sulfate exporter family transporter [Alphaproteobacteria bacterium]|nr:putative sulfate exporter family transporter [Alphaproteobacteria bacterium]